jgi:hypothetical protein
MPPLRGYFLCLGIVETYHHSVLFVVLVFFASNRSIKLIQFSGWSTAVNVSAMILDKVYFGKNIMGNVTNEDEET